ncbi:hypothetical protein RFI_02314 [Reticulomyxa filosa]|uniref:Uncharacterized protein n=1 Tax=Reticulomyxa filosa TaxID=46433 RepID=X6P9I3_RETFI|nr:hypothetical protein RFI_02314 [Reticulomyxa filosa]|eukprot:ETO34778.1 hypothetical protein RFI_02314 [Reticulomyxa filosa]
MKSELGMNLQQEKLKGMEIDSLRTSQKSNPMYNLNEDKPIIESEESMSDRLKRMYDHDKLPSSLQPEPSTGVNFSFLFLFSTLPTTNIISVFLSWFVISFSIVAKHIIVQETIVYWSVVFPLRLLLASPFYAVFGLDLLSLKKRAGKIKKKNNLNLFRVVVLQNNIKASFVCEHRTSSFEDKRKAQIFCSAKFFNSHSRLMISL